MEASLTAAIAAVTKAVAEDNAGHYEDALSFYNLSLAHFKNAALARQGKSLFCGFMQVSFLKYGLQLCKNLP